MWLVLLGFVALQAPFLGTAFRVDEPNILAIARQIALEPSDPYGFEINWLGKSQPAWEVLRNPPLVPYWIAGWAAIFGWSEVSLHVAMLPWALLAMLAAGDLARRTGMAAWLGAALLGFSVAFFVSAPLLMPDVMAVALSAAAVGLSLREERPLPALAIFAAAAAPLAKYTALAVIVPLAVIALRRKRGWAFAVAGAPIASLLIWSGISATLYGSSHLFASAEAQGGFKLAVVPILVALGLAVFPPGLVAGAVGRRAIVAAAAAGVFAFPVLRYLAENGPGSSLAGAAGVAIAVLILSAGAMKAAAEASTERLAALGWLAAAIGLTFTFQFVTSRYLLAAAPAAILLIGRLRTRVAVSFTALAVVVSIGVAWADARHASIYPRAADMVEEGEGAVWLAGHWGFQHYGVEAGGVMLELDRDPRVGTGHRILISEATFPGVTPGELMKEYRAQRLSRAIFRDSFPLRTQACDASVSFHGAGASSCENAYRVAIPWGFSGEPLDVIHVLQAGTQSGGEQGGE